MNTKKEKKRHRNQVTMNVIENTSGISFVEFKHIDDIRDRMPPPVGNTFQPWEEINATEAREDDTVIPWITEMLKSEAVVGRMVFMYEDRGIIGAPDFAEVILGDSYSWVASFWKRGHGLYFYSFERGYSWKIFSYDDRYAFLRIKLKKD